jgi:hypothetical protein
MDPMRRLELEIVSIVLIIACGVLAFWWLPVQQPDGARPSYASGTPDSEIKARTNVRFVRQDVGPAR